MTYPAISFGLVLKGVIKDCCEGFEPKANRFEWSAILDCVTAQFSQATSQSYQCRVPTVSETQRSLGKYRSNTNKVRSDFISTSAAAYLMLSGCICYAATLQSRLLMPQVLAKCIDKCMTVVRGCRVFGALRSKFKVIPYFNEMR